ncbi:hypothetical protein ES703_78926 [subsurface metagenome]
MSLLGGVIKLSELEIDGDKDWQGRKITNLKAIADGMVKGDIVYRGSDILERIPATYGKGFNFLQVLDMQYELGWADIVDIVIYLTGAENRIIAPIVLAIPKPEISVAVTEDHSGGGHPVDKTLTVPVPSISAAAELV